METIGKIWRWHRVDKLSISKIAKPLSASRNTVAKFLDHWLPNGDLPWKRILAHRNGVALGNVRTTG